MIRDFAVKNNFKILDTNIYQPKGRLFDIGHSKNISNILVGEINKYPVKILNYRYTTGSGKNSRSYNFTICEVSINEINIYDIIILINT